LMATEKSLGVELSEGWKGATALDSVNKPVIAPFAGFDAMPSTAPKVSVAFVAVKSCEHCVLAAPVVFTQAAMMFASVFSSETDTDAPEGSVPGAAPLELLTSALALAKALSRPVLLAPLAPMSA